MTPPKVATLLLWTTSVNKWTFFQVPNEKSYKEKNKSVGMYSEGRWERESRESKQQATCHETKRKLRRERVSLLSRGRIKIFFWMSCWKHSQILVLWAKADGCPMLVQISVWSSVVAKMGWVMYFLWKTVLCHYLKELQYPTKCIISDALKMGK